MRRWFFRYVGTKLLFPPVKIKIFGTKMAKFGPNYAFLVILGRILAFLAHLVPCPTKNNAKKVPSWFCVMWMQKILLPPVKMRNFGPKTAKFCPKYAFLGTYKPCWLIWCPVGWLVGGCCARAVSRKTPINFIIILYYILFDLTLLNKVVYLVLWYRGDEGEPIYRYSFSLWSLFRSA